MCSLAGLPEDEGEQDCGGDEKRIEVGGRAGDQVGEVELTEFETEVGSVLVGFEDEAYSVGLLFESVHLEILELLEVS